MAGDRPSLYDHPVLYDIIHAPGTGREVDGLEKIHRRHVGPATRRPAAGRPQRPVWLEPFCGTARHLRVAAARGISVIGVDRSAAMLGYARRRLESMGSRSVPRNRWRLLQLEAGDLSP